MTIQELEKEASKLPPEELNALFNRLISKLPPDAWRSFAERFDRVRRGWEETNHLLSTEANRQALERSRRDAEAGRLITKTMEELETLAADGD